MVHLRKVANGHLGKAPSGHLGRGFLFNVKDFTITWDGYTTRSGTDYHTAGTASGRFASTTTNPAIATLADDGTIPFSAGVNVFFIGPDASTTGYNEAGRINVIFEQGIGTSRREAAQWYSPADPYGGAMIDSGLPADAVFSYMGISNVAITIDSTW